MDTVEARLEVLKLAVSSHATKTSFEGPTDDGVLTTARKWAEFVVGPKPIESASQRPKGLDEK
jgi:hypothetical protein